MKKNTRNSNLKAALAILNGKTLVSNDRRSADASKIDFNRYTTPKAHVLAPAYGISNTMLNALSRLASAVTFVSGMPRFHFAR